MIKYERGKIIKGIVSGITNYGIFVKLDGDYSGLVHISEISSGYVKNPNDFAKVNDIIQVRILDIDDNKEQLKLSLKDIYREKRKNVHLIRETPHGFKTLSQHLPIWIDDVLNKKNK